MAEQDVGPDSISADTADSATVTLPPDSLVAEPGTIDTSKTTTVEIDTLEFVDTTEIVIGPVPESVDDGPGDFIGPVPVEDSIMVVEDSSGQYTVPESLLMEAGLDSIQVNEDSVMAVEAARRDSVRQEIIRSGIETRFLLAELYAYELNRPDSASTEYLLLAKEHPDSPFAIRALLAAASALHGPK